MSDRKLLENAARAAEIGFNDKRCSFGGSALYRGPSFGWWNPLTDDGDALRLAVKLRIRIEHRIRSTGPWYVQATWDCGIAEDSYDEEHGADPYAATRRAIVRAAAAIGEAME